MFRFKQFTIHQDKCAMKVGTDGVLAGAWTDMENATRILDIGTGTGLIALMLAQRSQNTCVDAVEIDENAFGQATENIMNSLWKDRINLYHCSIQDFFPEEKYDLIVSNPPFFSNSLKNPDQGRKTARHTDTLSPEELITNAKRLLSENGKLSLIFPANESQFIEQAFEAGFHCSRITKVHPKSGADAKRLLIEFTLSETTCKEDQLYIENTARHEYTHEYKELTKDFYLNF